jgi:hypothetical protein
VDGLKHLNVPGLRAIFIGWVVLMACVVAAALLRSRRRGGPMVVQPQPLPQMKGSLEASAGARRVDVGLGREILHLLEAGRRPEAVALVRERTGWGEQEADEAVARLEKLKKRLES